MSYQFCPSSNKNIDRLIEKPISHHLSVLGGHFSKFSASDVSGGEGGDDGGEASSVAGIV